MTLIRTFIYALACEEKNDDISPEALIAACNRFGVDNCCPIISKRLSLYG
jgi:hypothetical protein